MIRWTIALPVLAGACTSFENLEDACKDNVPGADGAAPGAEAAFARLTCYRRYVGLSQARLNPAISEAVQNHVEYLERNVSVSELAYVETQREEQGRAGFTGQYPTDRFDLVGFDTDNGSVQTWSVFAGFPANENPARFIDEFIHDPLFRDPLLAPGWRAGSWSRGVLEPDYEFGYLEAALFLPSQQNAFSPVSWPVDGQTGVATEWVNYYALLSDIRNTPPPFDELGAVIGYPITFTFGSDRGGGTGQNPLDIQVRDSILLGPNGAELDHSVVFPGNYFGGTNLSTIAIMPTEPLLPGAEYTVEVDVSWVSRERLIRQITFRTADVAGPPETIGN